MQAFAIPAVLDEQSVQRPKVIVIAVDSSAGVDEYCRTQPADSIGVHVTDTQSFGFPFNRSSSLLFSSLPSSLSLHHCLCMTTLPRRLILIKTSSASCGDKMAVL